MPSSHPWHTMHILFRVFCVHFFPPHHHSKILYVLGEWSLTGPIFVNFFRILLPMCPLTLLSYTSMENAHILTYQLLSSYNSFYPAAWLDYALCQIFGPACNEHYDWWMLWQTEFSMVVSVQKMINQGGTNTDTGFGYDSMGTSGYNKFLKPGHGYMTPIREEPHTLTWLFIYFYFIFYFIFIFFEQRLKPGL